jgi:hypothetical protein
MAFSSRHQQFPLDLPEHQIDFSSAARAFGPCSRQTESCAVPIPKSRAASRITANSLGSHACPFFAAGWPCFAEGEKAGRSRAFFIATHDSISYPAEDGNAMIIMGLDVPVFGCSEFTGHYKDQDVTFTIWVTS